MRTDSPRSPFSIVYFFFTKMGFAMLVTDRMQSDGTLARAIVRRSHIDKLMGLYGSISQRYCSQQIPQYKDTEFNISRDVHAATQPCRGCVCNPAFSHKRWEVSRFFDAYLCQFRSVTHALYSRYKRAGDHSFAQERCPGTCKRSMPLFLRAVWPNETLAINHLNKRYESLSPN